MEIRTFITNDYMLVITYKKSCQIRLKTTRSKNVTKHTFRTKSFTWEQSNRKQESGMLYLRYNKDTERQRR